MTVEGDDNEVNAPGESATQFPLSHVFQHGGKTVRIIDTPGIGDVRGVEQDKANFEFILDHISHIDELHGVCILLKPNNARLNIYFQFCVNELLTHLHRDAVRNMVFCFTNARSTFYKPGDTLPALKRLLEENSETRLKLDKNTLYCMDNESVRFLYAHKHGVAFSEDDQKNFEVSWNKSVNEVSRLFAHITQLVPHPIKNTLSVNNVRKTICSLGKPLAQITEKLQTDIALAEKTKDEMINSKMEKNQIAKNLYLLETDVKTVTLDQPRTVCTSKSCTDVIEIGGIGKTNYKTHCHIGCNCGDAAHSKVEGVRGHDRLRKCSAIDETSGICKSCGCSWTDHMKISYETSLETKLVRDQEVERERASRETDVGKIETIMDNLENRVYELNEEQKAIEKASALFACFLRWNAITKYNTSLASYLDHYIDQEGNKGTKGDATILSRLKRIKKDHETNISFLETAIGKGEKHEVLSIKELYELQYELYNLKYSGSQLKEMVDKSIQSTNIEFREKHVVRRDSEELKESVSLVFKNIFNTTENNAAGTIGGSQGQIKESAITTLAVGSSHKNDVKPAAAVTESKLKSNISSLSDGLQKVQLKVSTYINL